MTAKHHIDEINKLIITDWNGDANLKKFFQVYNAYIKKIKSKNSYSGYDEVVNFSGIKKMDFNFQDLKKCAKLASSFDQDKKTRMALIVNPGKSYVLANGYVMLRKLIPGNSKKVKVFVDYFGALKWLSSERK